MRYLLYSKCLFLSTGQGKRLWIAENTDGKRLFVLLLYTAIAERPVFILVLDVFGSKKVVVGGFVSSFSWVVKRRKP